VPCAEGAVLREGKRLAWVGKNSRRSPGEEEKSLRVTRKSDTGEKKKGETPLLLRKAERERGSDASRREGGFADGNRRGRLLRGEKRKKKKRLLSEEGEKGSATGKR